MSIILVGTHGAGGTTTVSPGWDNITGKVTGDFCTLYVSTRSDGTIVTPSGWSVALPSTTINGLKVAVFTKLYAGETGNASVSITGGTSSLATLSIRRATGSLGISVTTTGGDSTSGTGYSATGGSVTSASGDVLTAYTAVSSNGTGTPSGNTLTQAGATLANSTVVRNQSNASGATLRTSLHSADVTTGATGAPTYAATFTDAVVGGTVFVVLHEADPNPPPPTGSFVGASTSTDTAVGGNLTVAWPTGGNAPQAGDLAILVFTFEDSGTPTTPTGFILLDSDLDGGVESVIYTRICNGTETGNITLPLSIATNRRSAALGIWRGYSSVTAVASAGAPASGTSHDSPSVTFTGEASIVVAISERIASGTVTATAPTGFTKRAEFGTGGLGACFTAIADKALAVPVTSPQDPDSWTTQVASGAVVKWTLALRPGTSATPYRQAITAAGLRWMSRRVILS